MAVAVRLPLFATILFHSLLLTFSLLLPFHPASNTLIVSVCKEAPDKTYCTRILASNPMAAASTNKPALAKAVIELGRLHAEQTALFISHVGAKDPKMKKTFEACASNYKSIVASFSSAEGELKGSPDTSSYDVGVSMDDTRGVLEMLGAAKDPTSLAVIERTRVMRGYIQVAAAVTNSITGGGDSP